MSELQTRRFGSWRSPLDPASLAVGVVSLSDVRAESGVIYWVEGRPAEGGRQVLVGRDDEGTVRELFDAGFSARTRVHEYGGSSYTVRASTVWFSNDVDRRVWRLDPGSAATPVTPPEPEGEQHRFGDLEIGPDGETLYAVRERHGPSGVVNDLVAIPASGGAPVPVASGRDFYAAPRCSPDGRRLAYLCWDLPGMPWDESELYVAPIGTDGPPRRVAGGEGVSISQPRFAPDGRLCYLTDGGGFWVPFDEDGTRLAPDGFDYGGPDWVLGQSSYCFDENGSLYAVRHEAGLQVLGRCDPEAFVPVPLPHCAFDSLRRDGDHLVMLASAGDRARSVLRVDPSGGAFTELRQSQLVDERLVCSLAVPITFTGGDGLASHGLFYPPAGEDRGESDGALPPLVVLSHGGPTSAAQPGFDLRKQFFTSRGIAVVDVNYAGSSGYGRAYRERLAGRWGELDVADCVLAARHLADAGLVDPARIVIRGASAGGLTVLGALEAGDVFAAGSSHYGCADLLALTADTHKFESGYCDYLIGPLPDALPRYRERSPIEHVDRIDCPVIFFQGLEDRVVPSEQTEAIVAALEAQGVRVESRYFEGEGHGFRRAETIEAVAAAELEFFGTVLGFVPDLGEMPASDSPGGPE